MITEIIEYEIKPPAEISDYTPTKTWEEYVSDWIVVQETQDVTNWTLGDIACEVTRAFGTAKDTEGLTPLDKFAQAVGQKKETVRQYAWVSRTYPRREDRMTGLSWSHYRAAVRTENPLTWIEEAVNNDWSVAQLTAEIKRVEDATAVTEGTPCAWCGGTIEEGAYHVRQNGRSVARLCSPSCGVSWFQSLTGTVEEDVFVE